MNDTSSRSHAMIQVHGGGGAFQFPCCSVGHKCTMSCYRSILVLSFIILFILQLYLTQTTVNKQACNATDKTAKVGGLISSFYTDFLIKQVADRDSCKANDLINKFRHTQISYYSLSPCFFLVGALGVSLDSVLRLSRL